MSMASETRRRGASGAAKYIQVSGLIRRDIGRRISPGQYLPNENDLAARFEVNRHTVRRAVDLLVEEGLVQRQQGAGTVVLQRPIAYKVGPKTRFTEQIEEMGAVAGSEVLDSGTAEATSWVAEQLQIDPGDPVGELNLLRSADRLPIATATHYIPWSRYPKVIKQYEQGSLHALFDQIYGFTPSRLTTRVTAELPNYDDARALRVPTTQPVLRVARVNLDPQTGDRCELVVSRFRGDSIELDVAPHES